MQIYRAIELKKWEEKCHCHSLVQPVCPMSYEAVAITGLSLLLHSHDQNNRRRYRIAEFTHQNVFRFLLLAKKYTFEIDNGGEIFE